jgi:hypothetical protein
MLSWAGSVGAATVLSTQPPCTNSEGYCKAFFYNYDVPIIRSFTFNAPGPGVAQVFFNGSVQCSNLERNFLAVVDLQSQIVTSTGAQPNANAPSGLRLATVLEDADVLPYVNVTVPKFDSFDLASTRMFAISKAGNQTYHFKIGKLRIDPIVFCVVYNASFSLIFTSY